MHDRNKHIARSFQPDPAKDKVLAQMAAGKFDLTSLPMSERIELGHYQNTRDAFEQVQRDQRTAGRNNDQGE